MTKPPVMQAPWNARVTKWLLGLAALVGAVVLALSPPVDGAGSVPQPTSQPTP